jgi:hypothetical protein
MYGEAWLTASCHPPASRRRDRGTQYKEALPSVTGWPGKPGHDKPESKS